MKSNVIYTPADYVHGRDVDSVGYLRYNGKDYRVAPVTRREEELKTALRSRGVSGETVASLYATDCALADGSRKSDRIIALAYMLMDKYGDKYTTDSAIRVAGAVVWGIVKRNRENGRSTSILKAVEWFETQLAEKRSKARPTYLDNVLDFSYRVADACDSIAMADAIMATVSRLDSLRVLGMSRTVRARADAIFGAEHGMGTFHDFMEKLGNDGIMFIKNIHRKHGKVYVPGLTYHELAYVMFYYWRHAISAESNRNMEATARERKSRRVFKSA